MLKLSGISDSSRLGSILEIATYLPIRYRTHSVLGGARYIYIEDFKDSLLEIIVPCDSMELRGFTVLLVKNIAERPLSGNGKLLNGLPILSLPSNSEFRGLQIQRLELAINFSLCFLERGIEIQLGNIKQFDLEVIHRNISFLFFRSKILIGIRMLELAEHDIKRLRADLNSAALN